MIGASRKSLPEERRLSAEVAALAVEVHRYRTLIDELLDRNEDLRRSTLERILEPVVRDLIGLVVGYQRLDGSWRQRDRAAPEDVAEAFAAVSQDLQDVLARYGVEETVPRVGEPFDRREHRAIGKEPTGDPADDGTVSLVRAAGFRIGKRVLRYPEVVVHRYQPRSVENAVTCDGYCFRLRVE